MAPSSRKVSRKESSKKKVRPSPSASATSFSVGTKKKGNDGNTWVIIKASNGVNRWQKESGSKSSQKNTTKKDSHDKTPPKLKKHYFTLDNGGNPFVVFISKSSAEIYKLTEKSDDIDYDKPEPKHYQKLIKKYQIEKAFLGEDDKKYNLGNTILLKLKESKNRYVYVGHTIYEFSTTEPITKYYSLVGNSSVPYPVALSQNYAYFMLGSGQRSQSEHFGEYAPRDDFPEDTDWMNAYEQYYDFYYPTRGSGMKAKGKAHKFMKGKLIHKRLW